jgi:hypothetical protein
VPSEIIQAGRNLLQEVDWPSIGLAEDYRLAEIAAVCLQGYSAEKPARKLWRSYVAASKKRMMFLYNHERLFAAVLEAQPFATLDGLLLSSQASPSLWLRNRGEEARGSMFERVSPSTLIAWCAQDPTKRYSLLAEAIVPFRGSDEGQKTWTELAKVLLRNAPNQVDVLREFTAKFVPMSWSGSRSAIIEVNVRLLDNLDEFVRDPDPAVRAFVAGERQRFQLEIEAAQEWERDRSRRRDERFE